jgi:hypothetical protein
MFSKQAKPLPSQNHTPDNDITVQIIKAIEHTLQHPPRRKAA